jgi:hypothetical protein
MLLSLDMFLLLINIKIPNIKEMGGNRSLIRIFEKMRIRFRVGILKTLYELHLRDIRTEETSAHRARMLASRRLDRDLRIITFCPHTDNPRLVKMVPLVCDVMQITRKRKRQGSSKDVAYAVILMLYYGYVLSEQTDEFIPDMLKTLREVLGDEDGAQAYKQVIRIASSECARCSKLRKFFLFGVNL